MSELRTTVHLNSRQPAHSPLLSLPAAVQPLQINWLRAFVVILVHLLAFLALVPWLFSWTGVLLVLGGHYLFGMLGITLGYHRMLTHRALKSPLWFERFLATLGVCCLQETPARWVAIHRMHHQHSDKQADPHSPKAGFLWGHFGWILYENRDHLTLEKCDRYAHDVLRDRYYFWLEKGYHGMMLYVIHAALFFGAGFAVSWLLGESLLQGVQFGLSLLVWGVLVRTVFVWHVTWAVNSLTHMAGYRNYETREQSRNNWFVAFLAHGEGWHNNHHAKPSCANNRHRWWEFDLTYQVIRVFTLLGLARQVVHFDQGLTAKEG